MKRTIILLLAALGFLPQQVRAQAYDALWQRVSDAERKDLPKTQIKELDYIIERAKGDRQYGHLLKAEVQRTVVKASIAPDSLKPAVQQMLRCAQEMEARQPHLAAVYYVALGKMAEKCGGESKTLFVMPGKMANVAGGGEALEVAASYYDKALAQPAMLARHNAGQLVPLVMGGKDSEVFDNSLLALLCMETKRFDILEQYYLTTDNRPAQLMAALLRLEARRDRREDNPNVTFVSRHEAVEMLDSLIGLYKDLDICCEAAIMRCEEMPAQNNRQRADKVAWIDMALAKWGKWKRAPQLKNMRGALTGAYVSMDYDNNVPLLAERGQGIKIEGRNVKGVRLVITPTTLTGAEAEAYKNSVFGDDLDNDRRRLWQKLEKKMLKGHSRTVAKAFKGHAESDVFSDSLTLPALPVGVYVMEIGAPGSKAGRSRTVVCITNLMVLKQSLPGKMMRMAVVDATTGQPVGGAKIDLRHRNEKPLTLTCNAEGEASHGEQDVYGRTMRAYTANDNACPWNNVWGSFTYYESKDDRDKVQLYTDRRVYRPGQTVNVSLLAWRVKHGEEHMVQAARQVEVTMRDANGQEVKRLTLTTDSLGSASAQIVLPEGRMGGHYSLLTDNRLGGNTYIIVDEYKRPTFEVEFDKYEGAYANGDTITVKGRAKSYAGVPVQGAKVSYAITRGKAWWCRWWAGQNTVTMAGGHAVTNDKGEFEVKVPMVLPSWEEEGEGMGQEQFYRMPRFYDFTVEADVTDQSGETHSGDIRLPLGSKKQALSCEMPDKVRRDLPAKVHFALVNAAGNELEDTVNYYIDNNNKTYTAKANTDIDLMQADGLQLPSGRHKLVATCGEDTVEHTFVVFALTDTKPCEGTKEWFYTSHDELPLDGSEVTVQVGTAMEQVHVLYTVTGGNTLLESGCMELDNEIRNLKYRYKPEYGTGLLLTFVWVKDGKRYGFNKFLAKAKPDKRLVAKWVTFRDRLQPGQEETWTLHLAHADGKPAKAQLMATMYDKSLDQLEGFDWNLYIGLYLPEPSTHWLGSNLAIMPGLSVSADGARYGVSPLVYSSLDISLPWYFGGGAIYGMRRSDRMMLMSAPMANMAVAKEESALEDSAMPEHVGGIMSKDGNASGMAGKKTVTAGGTTDKAMKPDDGPKLQLRENMQETAFFYPALTTGADGNVNISFTLPESVTTWRFMGIAHDKDMNNVMVENQTVAQKTLMVQPNMPRFVREGDKAVVATRVHNTSAGKIETDVRLTLIDAETMSEVTALTKTISIDANSTEAVNFSLPPMTADRMMVCRITASGNGFSDGEQHYLPVMPSKELVTNTLPITQMQPGTVNINLGNVMPKHGEAPRLTIEYTNNPAWLMVQALPFVAGEQGDDAISVMAAYYANALGLDIIGKAPQAKATFAQWRQEKGTETSMMSALEKNQELKQMVLSETPWVADACKESEQKQLLANFFDDNMMQYRLGQAIRKLEALQNSDGSWSWFKGMDGSPHITAQVLEMMARLDILAGRQQATGKMQGRAMQYLGDVVVKEVEEIMRLKKKGLPYNICNYSALQWLYITAISHRDLSAREQKAAIFLLDCMKEQRNTESLHAKAVMAVVLAAYGEKTMAKEYLQSLDEYMVSTPEAGRYYDTPRAAYSWVDYRIPTQVAAMEAFRLVVPESTAVVDDMRRWLLHEKRTQAWATPINSVNAIYAFLCDNTGALQGGEKSVISLDGKALPLPKATAGMGYVKTQVDAEGKKTLSVKKTSKGTSWGAVYAQAWQQTSDVESRGQGMSVKREVMVSGKAVDNNAKSQGGDARSLNVGDKVKVRITIQADRDYDFVQVSDRRAACMEPVSQLSGYGWGYYISPKDNVTNYYFDFMSKGTHVIETEYYIDRPGTYTTGTCQVQCAYAPEFTAREGAKVVRVE